jgi:23S rRNA pseudouridine1911/1915/1917 synthase
MTLDVVFEDNHCLAVNKPAGLLSQGDISGDPNLVELAANYLRTRYGKPGNVYVGLLHRLDRPTSGVVLLAKTSKAASRLSAQFRAGSIIKIYWAMVEGTPQSQHGEWVDLLAKDTRQNRSAVLAEDEPAAKVARVSFQVLDHEKGVTKLELRPSTGRSHQLRVQLAERGMPIVGDTKYGARSRLRAADGRSRIALHARRLIFTHPTRREEIVVDAPVPADWPERSKQWRGEESGSSKPEEESGP